ncbi:MAG: ribonuclease III [Parabacteroides sp.]
MRKIIGFMPRDLHLYEQAFIHRSCSLGAGIKGYNNERLEFLGDAILTAVVADRVYKQFPNKREGFLTNLRSKIVSRESLNRIAAELGLADHMVYSSRIHSHNNYIYGNALEALIGAVYLDLGYEKCRLFIERVLLDGHVNVEKLSKEQINFKSRMLEWSQKNRIDVEFRLVDSYNDAEGSPVFQTALLIADTEVGVATGYSKKESHQNVAKIALKKLASDREVQTLVHRLREERKARETDMTESESTSEENTHSLPLDD